MIEISGGMATQMPDSVKKKVTGNTLMEFTNDGKYILTGMDKLFHNGNYILSDDEKTLTITPEATKESEKNTIEQISESKLIFTDKLGTRLVAVPQ